MKEFYTIKQAAALLGLHRGQLWRIMKTLEIGYTVLTLNRRHHLIKAQDVLTIKAQLDRERAILSAPEGQPPAPAPSVVVQEVVSLPESLVSLSRHCIAHGIPYWTAQNYIASGDLPVVLDKRGKRCLDAEGRRLFDALFRSHPKYLK